MCQLAVGNPRLCKLLIVSPLTLQSIYNYIMNHMTIILLKMINYFLIINQDSGRE